MCLTETKIGRQDGEEKKGKEDERFFHIVCIGYIDLGKIPFTPLSRMEREGGARTLSLT
jgi:hypothetical protein